MKDAVCRIEKNQHITERLYLMELLAPDIAKETKAGQFVMLRVSKALDPMGRRAFAIADVRGDKILIFYEVLGRGTYMLSQLREGEYIPILGPLGKGLFPKEGDRHLLLGGGVGLAGLTLLGKGLRKEGKSVLFLYAGRSERHLGMEEWLREEGFDFILYTEDGSKGRKGLITNALKDFDTSWTIHACGPKAMLRALKEIKRDYKMYLSLEGRMACGWGVCLGCVIPTREGYKRVCYEGPVFDSEEVIL